MPFPHPDLTSSVLNNIPFSRYTMYFYPFSCWKTSRFSRIWEMMNKGAINAQVKFLCEWISNTFLRTKKLDLLILFQWYIYYSKKLLKTTSQWPQCSPFLPKEEAKIFSLHILTSNYSCQYFECGFPSRYVMISCLNLHFPHNN